MNNLADNLQLFGLAPGSTNLFGATYSVFGEIVKSQYPELLPSFAPADKIVDTSYLEGLAKAQAGKMAAADLAVFHPGEQVKGVVSRRSWDIQFATGSDRFTPAAAATLGQLFQDLVVAGGTLVEIHGHTDNVGGNDKNQQLAESRAFAVKR